MSGSNGGGSTTRSVVRSLSAVALVLGLLVSVALLATHLDVIALFVLGGVVPSLLGYAGLAWSNALPWQGSEPPGVDEDADLVEELKERYARGELDDDEMERKVEALLNADEEFSTSRSRERETEYGRL